MRLDITLRTWLAVGIVAIMAALVGLLSGSPATLAVSLGLGIAAALVASHQPVESSRAVEAPDPPASTMIDEALDAIVEPVLILNDGRITLANAAARELLGAHVVGEDARVAIRHPAAADALFAPLPPGSVSRPVELVGLGLRDQRWQMRVTATTADTRIVTLVDQTGDHATERMRVDFVANASHELRTPLASILGYVETLRDEAGDDPAIRNRFLRIVFDEARRMQRLVDDLMSLSRIEAEKYRLPSETVDLGPLIGEVQAELANGIGARGREIVVHHAEGLPSIVGDRAQISQLLHNLVGNALKYGAAGTSVAITLAVEGEKMLRVTVQDRGEGIAPEHLPRLTERFYRADPGRSRSLGGTGLGLAIVKHIVERHRGRLEIVSVVGTGTSVSVSLPAADVIKP